MSKRIGITGVTGFIGRHFLASLLDQGWRREEIVALVRRTSPYRGWIEGLGVRIVWGDVGDGESLFRFVEEVRGGILVHCAGFVGRDRERLWRVNVDGTENLLKAIGANKVERLVYLSSVAVISGNKDLPLTDDMPLKASMDYGQSKIEGERLVWQAIDRGVPAVILRPGMIYGKGEPHMLPKIVELMRNRLFFLFGRMDNPWHLCGMQNLLWVMHQALVQEEMLGRSFICADEEVLTGEEIFTAIAEGLGIGTLPRIPEWTCSILERVPKVSNIVKFMRKARLYDISRIKGLGYQDVISPREGLRLAVGN